MNTIQILTNQIPAINWVWWFDWKMATTFAVVIILYVMLIDHLRQ